MAKWRFPDGSISKIYWYYNNAMECFYAKSEHEADGKRVSLGVKIPSSARVAASKLTAIFNSASDLMNAIDGAELTGTREMKIHLFFSATGCHDILIQASAKSVKCGEYQVPKEDHKLLKKKFIAIEKGWKRANPVVQTRHITSGGLTDEGVKIVAKQIKKTADSVIPAYGGKLCLKEKLDQAYQRIMESPPTPTAMARAPVPDETTLAGVPDEPTDEDLALLRCFLEPDDSAPDSFAGAAGGGGGGGGGSAAPASATAFAAVSRKPAQKRGRDNGLGGRDDGLGGRDDGLGGRDDGLGGRDDGLGGDGKRHCGP